MSTHKVALITDSTCDIPPDLIGKYDITAIPAFIIWGADELRDRIDIQPEAFYRRLLTDPAHPTTAHPTPHHFFQAYTAAVQAGAEEIVVVTVSSAMSGTMQAARQAAEMSDVPVHIVDSKGPTMSTGWQVLAAARARAAGGDAAQMVSAAEFVRQRLVQFVSLDTLEFLHRGGRIGNATRFIGTLLNVKPMVCINHVTGLVEPGERTRTRKRALETLYRTFFSQLNALSKLRIAVLHGNALADAQALAQRIQQEFNPLELITTITTPVLGVHTGPGAVALCGYSEE